MVNVQELADDLNAPLWVLREFAPDIFPRHISGCDSISDADAEMVRECWITADQDPDLIGWLPEAEHAKI